MGRQDGTERHFHGLGELYTLLAVGGVHGASDGVDHLDGVSAAAAEVGALEADGLGVHWGVAHDVAVEELAEGFAHCDWSFFVSVFFCLCLFLSLSFFVSVFFCLCLFWWGLPVCLDLRGQGLLMG